MIFSCHEFLNQHNFIKIKAYKFINPLLYIVVKLVNEGQR